jgi:hypothetical protein
MDGHWVCRHIRGSYITEKKYQSVMTGRHMRKSEVLGIADNRNHLSDWSEKHCFSKRSDFSSGTAKLDFNTLTTDPAFAGTNSGIYEISTKNNNRYPNGRSKIVNIGLTNTQIKTRIASKFRNRGEQQSWNQLASNHDLFVRFRSNQVVRRGTSIPLEQAEALYLHAFEGNLGSLPIQNTQKRQLIKTSEVQGHPEPKDRARLLIDAWKKDNQQFVNENEIRSIDLESLEGVDGKYFDFIEREFTQKDFLTGVESSKGRGKFGCTRIIFYTDSMCIAGFIAGKKNLTSTSFLQKIPYESINFESQTESDLVRILTWGKDCKFSHQIPGFGSLCKSLGTLAAIAELR